MKEHTMRNAIKILLMLTPLLAVLPLFLGGCGEKSEANTNNLKQIYEQEGVPVRTIAVKSTSFSTWLSYNAVLTGIEESAAQAMIADKVEKVYADVGEYVEKDTVIVGFPTDNPSARYYQAKVAYENAKKSYERIESLYKSGGVSRQDRDNAYTAFEVASADWDSAQQTVYAKAPISGYITKLNVRESDNVQPGDELFVISKMHKLKAKVWATDDEVLNIETGQPVVAEWNGKETAGRVVQVDMAMDQDRKAFGIVVELDNRANSFKIGVTASVRIITYQNPSALVVERKDILREGENAFVYVIQENRAKKQPVTLGRQQGLDVEINNGLKDGIQLITEGQMLIEEGSKVKIVSAE
jgi:RND family efflux transporter MFP subunit